MSFPTLYKRYYHSEYLLTIICSDKHNAGNNKLLKKGGQTMKNEENLSSTGEYDKLDETLKFLNVRNAKKHWKKAIESLKSARLLYNNGYYNNSVSRSYYAIYQGLSSILKEREIFPYNNSSHSAVLKVFRDDFLTNEENSSTFDEVVMVSLRGLRIKSDYKSRNCIKMDAEEILTIAENFIKSNNQGFLESYNFNTFLGEKE